MCKYFFYVTFCKFDSDQLKLVLLLCYQFPQTGELIVKRLIIQFRKGYRRNDKSLCMSASRFIAHLVNQRVVSVLLLLVDALNHWLYDTFRISKYHGTTMVIHARTMVTVVVRL